MKLKLVFIVILCLMSFVIARRKHEPRPSDFACPKSCDCDKLFYYKESTCTANGSTLELLLRQTSVFTRYDHKHIRANHLTVNCTTGDQFPYEILPEFRFVDLVFVRYNGCPLPASGTSFNQLHTGLYEFHFNTTESISLAKEHFIGLDNLQLLHLKSSSTIDLADNVFADLPLLDELTIVSNEINEKIFDHPSNVTFLSYGGLNSGAFNSEVLKKWTQLTTFGLTDSKIQHLNKDLFANSPQIRSVFFKFNEIDSFDPDTFESLEQLQSLSLVNNKIATLPERLIIKSNEFNYIRIECDEDTGFDTLPDEFLSNLPKLRVVYIFDCNMKSVPANLLKNSTNVYDLNLRGNSLTDLPENFLANQTGLGHINFSKNRFRQFPDKFFENILTKPVWNSRNLYILFQFNGIERLSPTQISYLSQFEGFFDFRFNSIDDLSALDGLVKGNEDSFINFENNPINCDCSSVKAFKQYAKITPNSYQRHINGTICTTPISLNGTAVINVDC